MEEGYSDSEVKRSTRSHRRNKWNDDMVDDEVFEDYMRTLEELEEEDIEGKYLCFILYIIKVVLFNY